MNNILVSSTKKELTITVRLNEWSVMRESSLDAKNVANQLNSINAFPVSGS